MILPTPSILDIDLDSADGHALLASTAAAHGPLLAPAARQLSRLFLVRSPWAPGLRFAGGRISASSRSDSGAAGPVFSLSGPADTIEAAIASVVGEGIELVSQVQRDDDVALEANATGHGLTLDSGIMALLEQSTAHLPDDRVPIAWMQGLRATDGEIVHVPADWCLRRPPTRSRLHPPWAMGTGVAAGPTFEHAATRALLELVERDAVALWWEGGRRGRPIALDAPAGASAAALARNLRQGETDRLSWLLDITTDIGIPCVAAISCGGDGRAVALGFAARTTLAEAGRAAMLENAQMEIALMIAHARVSGGDATITVESDLRYVERSTLLDADSCPLLHARGMPLRHDTPATADPLARVVAALDARGIAPVLVDLTRPELGLAVVRAIAPGLQPAPSALTTTRLEKMRTSTGGGARHTAGISAF